MEEMERRVYRSLLLQIAQGLTEENRRNLVFLFELPEKWKESDARDILDELGHRNKISSASLDSLVTALEELHREDLVNIVRQKMEEQKHDQDVLSLKQQIEIGLKSAETFRLAMENIKAIIAQMKEDHSFRTDVLRSAETMMTTARDKNKEARITLRMAALHLGFKSSRTSETRLVVGHGLLPTESSHKQPIAEEPSMIHKTPPRSPTVSKRVKSGVKKILKRNQPITNFQSVVATPPRRRTISPAPPKEEEEETLPSNAEDSPYESIDGTQMTDRRHSLDSKKEEMTRKKKSQMVFAVQQVPKIIDTPREDATHTPSMHTQGKPKTTDDSDEDNDESGYTGSTTGGDSGMEVPLYEIPILRKKETIAEEEPEYHFPRPQDPLKT